MTNYERWTNELRENLKEVLDSVDSNALSNITKAEVLLDLGNEYDPNGGKLL